MPSSSRHSCYFTKCCFIIDLKTGCFIWAYLNPIGIIINIISEGFFLGKIIAEFKSIEAIPADIEIFCVLLLFMLLLLGLVLVFNIVLLVGLHKDKPEHVKSYFIFHGIFVGIYIVFLIISIIFEEFDVPTICRRIAQILVTVYFLLVIRSYHIDMRSNRNRRTEKV